LKITPAHDFNDFEIGQMREPQERAMHWVYYSLLMFITEQLQSRDSELRKNLEKDEPLPSITCNDFVWHVLTCEIHVISDDISVCLNVVLIFRQIRLQNVNAGHWTRRVHDQLGSLRRCVLSRFVGMSMHVYRCIMLHCCVNFDWEARTTSGKRNGSFAGKAHRSTSALIDPSVPTSSGISRRNADVFPGELLEVAKCFGRTLRKLAWHWKSRTGGNAELFSMCRKYMYKYILI
jgi:hypothetical protein